MSSKILTKDECLAWTHDSINEALKDFRVKEPSSNDIRYLGNLYSQLGQEYVEYKQDFELFKKHTKESWTYYEKLLSGEDIPEELLWSINCSKVMQLLAAGFIEEAVVYTKHIWEALEASQKYASPYMELVAKTFFPLVLDGHKAICYEWIGKFYEYCNKPRGMKYFVGFVKMMDGIFQRNGKLIEEGLQDIIKSKGSIKRSDFDSLRNKMYCLWGIGLANLAISRGIQFTVPDDAYLPRELLIGG